MTDILIDSDLIIDRNKLEEEASEIPALFDYWMSQESMLDSEKRRWAGNLKKRVRSMSLSEITAEFGLSTNRVTDGMVKDIVEADERYQEIDLAHLEATAKRRSYGIKVELVKVLASLHGQGYFSKTESSSQPVKELAAKKAEALVGETMVRQIKQREKRREGEGKPRRPQR